MFGKGEVAGESPRALAITLVLPKKSLEGVSGVAERGKVRD